MIAAIHSRALGSAAVAIASLLLAVPVQAANWTARGNEPGWHAELTDTTITFSTLEGETVTVEMEAGPMRGEGIEIYSGRAGDATMTLVAVDKVCADTMTGMPHPKTIVVTKGDMVYLGCGGEPLSLLLGDWHVETLSGQAVLANSEPTLGFDLDGSLHGNASCNRYFGSFTLTGEGLTLLPAGTTRMACDGGLMQQEDNLIAALAQVQRFSVAPGGQLQLLDADGKPAITARR